MRWLYQFNIRSKLILTVMTVALVSIGAIAYVSYSSGKQAIEEEIFNHLTSIRASKALQIEAYLARIQNHTISLTEDDMIVEAVQQFTRSFQQLNDQSVPPEWDDAVRVYYREEMLPKLAKNIDGDPILEQYLPRTVAGRYLQYHYLAANPHPLGKKDLLNQEKADTAYGKAHAHFQPILRSLIDRFGYYDLFLIDMDGILVYTVRKETDFATSLKDGPYRQSNLASAWTRVLQNTDRSSFQIADFDHYRPSYGTPAAFIASPIFDRTKPVGVLAIQLPVDHINDVMTGKRQWLKDGLGETGETYLVGHDLTMRSISRFLIEDPEKYSEALKATGMSEEDIERIMRQETTILHQEVNTEAVKDALAGKSGTRVILDYRRVPVLSSYVPLKTKGLHWVVLSEMDEAETRSKVRSFGRSVLVLSVAMVLLSTVAAMLVAGNVVRPMRVLLKEAREVTERKGGLIEYQSQDEFGDVASSLNGMLEILHARAGTLESEKQEYEKLLQSIIPQSFIRRFKEGEETVADHFPQVSVLVAEMAGIVEYASSLDTPGVVSVLDGLFSRLDDATEKHGVERFTTSGNQYIAVSGVSAPRLDHARCITDFAKEMLKIVREFRDKTGTALKLRVGIDSGSVIVGIAIQNGFLRDLWGEPVQAARQLQLQCKPDCVEVSQRVYQNLRGVYEFESVEGDGAETTAWRLKTDDSTPQTQTSEPK